METMAEHERTAFAEHAKWLQALFADGRLILSGPCLGRTNTGIVVFESPDEESAQRLVATEPVTRTGIMQADLRPFRLGLIRSRVCPE